MSGFNQSLYCETISRLVFALGASGTMVQVAVDLGYIYVLSVPCLFVLYLLCRGVHTLPFFLI